MDYKTIVPFLLLLANGRLSSCDHTEINNYLQIQSHLTVRPQAYPQPHTKKQAVILQCQTPGRRFKNQRKLDSIYVFCENDVWHLETYVYNKVNFGFDNYKTENVALSDVSVSMTKCEETPPGDEYCELGPLLSELVVDTHGMGKIPSDGIYFDMFCWHGTGLTTSLFIMCKDGTLMHDWTGLNEKVTAKEIKRYCGKSCPRSALEDFLQNPAHLLSLAVASGERQTFLSGESVPIRCSEGVKITVPAFCGQSGNTFPLTCYDGMWRFPGESAGSTRCSLGNTPSAEKYDFGERKILFGGQQMRVSCGNGRRVELSAGELSATCLENGAIEIEPGQDSDDVCLDTRCTASNLVAALHNNKMALASLGCFRDHVATADRCGTKCQRGFEWANDEMALGGDMLCKNKVWAFVKKSGEEVPLPAEVCVPEKAACDAAKYNENGYTVPFNLALKGYEKLCAEGKLLDSFGRCVL